MFCSLMPPVYCISILSQRKRCYKGSEQIKNALDILFQGDILKDVPESEGTLYSDTKREIFELVPAGGYWREVDGSSKKHKRIRRVSMDQFYALITGQENAFYQMCMILPDVVTKVVSENKGKAVPEDIVFTELEKIVDDKNISFVTALYLLGFKSYAQF